MSKFIADILSKEKRSFKTPEEAIFFIVERFNKWTEFLQELYKSEKEASLKEHLIIKRISELICDKLEVYGIKISYDDLQKQARADIDDNWPRIKKEVAEIIEARKKAVDDLLKSI